MIENGEFNNVQRTEKHIDCAQINKCANKFCTTRNCLKVFKNENFVLNYDDHFLLSHPEEDHINKTLRQCIVIL